MAIAKTAREFQPPKTGNEIADRAFADLQSILQTLDSRLSDLDQMLVRKVETDGFRISFETLIEYTGGAGTIFLPLANSIPGKRSRAIYILNTGTGNLTVTASGTDLVNGAASVVLAATSMLILQSNGVTKWISK